MNDMERQGRNLTTLRLAQGIRSEPSPQQEQRRSLPQWLLNTYRSTLNYRISMLHGAAEIVLTIKKLLPVRMETKNRISKLWSKLKDNIDNVRTYLDDVHPEYREQYKAALEECYDLLERSYEFAQNLIADIEKHVGFLQTIEQIRVRQILSETGKA